MWPESYFSVLNLYTLYSCLEASYPSTEQTFSYSINLNAVALMKPTLTYSGKFHLLVTFKDF